MPKAGNTNMSRGLESRAVIHNDEPTIEDRLNRDRYAEAFARFAETCDTPLVVGLYGTWGVGKTSLMNLIEKKLDTERARAVWFDPWQHQFDENPVVALAHTLFDSLERKWKDEGKKLVTVIAAAFGSRLLKFTTRLDAKDILKLGKIYEEENFQVRETRVRLRKHFEKLVERAREHQLGSKRLVFFIDDLDRCMPHEALRLLEALKLYLNIEGCVYFLGVDRQALEQSVKHCYEGLEMSEVDYLDKIIQLPFTVPPIEPHCMDSFVESLISRELHSCRNLLVEGLGDNPRQVKRFINTLTLNHQLADSLDIPNYNPKVLALLLLIQLITPELYGRVSRRPELLIKLNQKHSETQDLYEEFLATHERLRNAFSQVEVPDEENLKTYIYLTKVASVSKEAVREPSKIDLHDVLKKHERWLATDGEEGERADLFGTELRGTDLRGIALKKSNLRRAYLSEANLSEADLREADLSSAKLRRANLYCTNLIEAKLHEADLREADLRGANLKGANLYLADLRGADLVEANLYEAHLSGAKMRGANLGKAKLCGARLSGINLLESNVSGADLRGADLRSVAITDHQLKDVITNERTVLPDGSTGPFVISRHQ